MTSHIAQTHLPEWRLDDLYAGRDDPRIEADIEAARAANAGLVALKGQFLAQADDPARLGELLDKGLTLYEHATNGLWSVGAYASLATSTAREDANWARFEADLRARSAQIGAESLFFALELNALSDAQIAEAYLAHPPAARQEARRVIGSSDVLVPCHASVPLSVQP